MKKRSYILFMLTCLIAMQSMLPADSIQSNKELDSYFTSLKRGIRCYFKKNCRKEDRQAVHDTIKTVVPLILFLLWLKYAISKNRKITEFKEIKEPITRYIFSKDIESIKNKVYQLEKQGKTVPFESFIPTTLEQISRQEQYENPVLRQIDILQNLINTDPAKFATQPALLFKVSASRVKGMADLKSQLANIQTEKNKLIDIANFFIEKAISRGFERNLLKQSMEKFKFNHDTLQKFF